jgi:alkylhydroperoxidase/carboxymuconolactone decarboxylase family protein YurZ
MITKKEVMDYFRNELGWVPEFVEILADYAPSALKGMLEFRRGFMAEPPVGALPKKVKELIFVVLDTVAGNVEGGKAHAKAAIKAGATVAEIAESLVITMYLMGVPTMEVAGKEILKAAIEQVDIK